MLLLWQVLGQLVVITVAELVEVALLGVQIEVVPCSPAGQGKTWQLSRRLEPEVMELSWVPRAQHQLIVFGCQQQR